MAAALKRISAGPRHLVDPEEELKQLDVEEFLRYKCKEILPGERY